MQLSLDVRGKSTLEESLDLYVQGELMEGDNQYLCEEAGKKVLALHAPAYTDSRCLLQASSLSSLHDLLTLQVLTAYCSAMQQKSCGVSLLPMTKLMFLWRGLGGCCEAQLHQDPAAYPSHPPQAL